MSKSVVVVVLKLALLLTVAVAGGEPPRGWVPPAPAGLLTVAESSDFKETSTHLQVVELLDALAEQSENARRVSMGKTVEGRDIPVIVFADPPISTPAEARESGKVVVLLFGNIHAGEVDAKEALLMLARELTLGEGAPALLENLIIAIAPIYNADGNDAFGKTEENRPRQGGPDAGVGKRHNAMDLDLNRDFIKLEAPETRALVRFMNQWDPAIVMDGHTTNGSLHRFLMTYAGAKLPAGDARVIDFTYDTFFPALDQGMKARADIDTFLYGNFESDHTQWSTFPAQPRYGTNYIGLRNRLSILSESYAYASYEERIRGTLEFSREMLRFADENHDKIRNLVRMADATQSDTIALRTQAVPLPKKAIALGFEETVEEGQPIAGDPREYEVEILDKWEPTLSVDRPYAYLVPASQEKVIENLKRHGIEVHELREDIHLDITAYTLDEISRADRAFQGHAMVTADATPTQDNRRIEAGTIIVPTAQPLGALAAYMLEPEADDGLVAWNFFDDVIEEGKEFAVLRLEEEAELLTVPARPLPQEQASGKVISYDLLYNSGAGRPNFSGSPIGGLSWVDDDHYLQSRGRQLMVINADTGQAKPFHDADAMAEALTEQAGIGARIAERLAGTARFRFNDDRSRALVDHENDLYIYDFAGQKAVRLTDTPDEPEELTEISPDGSFVAFVRENDLYVVDFETQTTRALTTGGTDILRNGKADWIYFEELFGRSWKAYWWAPDSSAIAFLETDASMVDTYTLVDDLAEPLRVEAVRYPKPGSPNPTVRLGIAPVDGEDVNWVDLGQYTPSDFLISRVGWWPDASRVYFFGQNREQTWMDLLTVNLTGGEPTRLLRDQTEAWVSPEGGPWVQDDGSFLLVSDRSGWRHVYHFDETGELIGPVTSGEWDVRGVEHVGEETIYFNATKDNPIATNLYRAEIDGGAIERLTQGPGSHSIAMNPSATRFIDSWSTRTQPTRVALFAGDGTEQRTLDTNPVYEIAEYAWGSDEQFQIETEDGFLLEASLVKPADFDAGRKYPVWMTTYAGPYAPSVDDNWGGGRTWDQMLANEGIVVMRVDPRPASGKGPQSAWTAYRQLGVQELKDLESAVAWLAEQPWADTSRVGLSGHSYGGYMVSYAMTHSKVFSAGIAGAPVTDWRDYDTIYTERYMGTPQSNSAGYDKSSAVKAAGDLHGELLLLHGAMDDNVHPQNTIRFAKALQNAGKPFEMMIYPGFRHGIGGRHYNELTFNFIRRTMGVEDGSRDDSQPSIPASSGN